MRIGLQHQVQGHLAWFGDFVWLQIPFGGDEVADNRTTIGRMIQSPQLHALKVEQAMTRSCVHTVHRVHSALDYQTPAVYAANCVLPASATPQPPEHSRVT